MIIITTMIIIITAKRRYLLFTLEIFKGVFGGAEVNAFSTAKEHEIGELLKHGLADLIWVIRRSQMKLNELR